MVATSLSVHESRANDRPLNAEVLSWKRTRMAAQSKDACQDGRQASSGLRIHRNGKSSRIVLHSSPIGSASCGQVRGVRRDLGRPGHFVTGAFRG